jgi:thiamine monophosphate kinase
MAALRSRRAVARLSLADDAFKRHRTGQRILSTDGESQYLEFSRVSSFSDTEQAAVAANISDALDVS